MSKWSPGTSSTLRSARSRSVNSDDRNGCVWRTNAMAPASGAMWLRSVLPLDPCLHDRIVRADDPAGARQECGPAHRLERDARKTIVDPARSDRRVVVDRPEVGDDAGWRDGPADPEAGQAIRFRQAAGDDRALVAPPHGGCVVRLAFRPSINLVVHDPCADGRGDAANLVERGGIEPRAGRIVGIAEENRAGLRRDERSQFVEVGRPLLTLPRVPRPVRRQGRTVAPSPFARPEACI